ncbi:ribosomal maturation YjgA family protein [Asanoa siamensis]|uniref:DUF2809 domain-containing protein n=1 Tax=Asanoa siamensis TaxID=926357 RepID=A0ABQ4CWC4_9ACTN|nr:DUF2809 domain-containing protein [Asanoa siamensis]GIF75601.1 hypothetical protein Asi02nite_51190 [Asanoa siamensis]
MRGRTRLAAAAAAAGFLAVAFGIRLASGAGVLDSTGALAQRSGTALYASMVYAGVFVLRPATRPPAAAAAAIAFCWLVELLQLTGWPAALSARSLIARLVLGVQFDAADLLWYAVGVLPLALLHHALRRTDP